MSTEETCELRGASIRRGLRLLSNRLGASHGMMCMRWVRSFAALAVLALFSVAQAFSANFTVTNTADSGPGSLRQAIADAVSGDTIDFDLTLPGTITLTSGQLIVDMDLTMTGPGPSLLAISGNSLSRVFSIVPGVTVEISGLTIADGRVLSANGGGILNLGTLMLTNSTVSGNSADIGGGIINVGGTLTLTNSTVSGNSASVSGGGIFNFGTLTLTNSTVSDNTASAGASTGGGISNFGTLTLSNSTVSGNSTDARGGGIFNDSGGTATLTNNTVSGNSSRFTGGGIDSNGTLTLNNSTVSGNAAVFNGGGIRSDRTLNVKNTIVANSPSGGNCLVSGTATSHGHNLSDDTTCTFFSGGLSDLTVLPGAAGLGPLQNNGGPTETHALLPAGHPDFLPGSPAIDAIPFNTDPLLSDCTDVSGNPITTDQRGFPRPEPSGTHCDMGAYEFQPGLDLEGPITSNVISSSNPLPVFTNWILTATVSDVTTGGSNIDSAEYQIDGGPFSPMAAQDGAFDEVTEDVEDLLPDVFQSPGVYEICARGTDAPGNVGATECIFLPVYDPDGGFVTGGGWINSPAGASTAFPLAVGKATFGFVSKYLRGATIPTGQTQFQFKAGNLNFHSSSYEWLVVAGARAQYKGTGTINGAGNYGFMLTAIDGQVSGGGGVDKFRIKIWDKDNDGAIVYDNQTGDQGDNADPTTALGGGSIVIHSK